MTISPDDWHAAITVATRRCPICGHTGNDKLLVHCGTDTEPVESEPPSERVRIIYEKLAALDMDKLYPGGTILD